MKINMNEQDTAAADTILLMEAEEKVKMRILQVISDVIWGYSGSVVMDDYQASIVNIHRQLTQVSKEETKRLLQQVTLNTSNVY